jgi:ribosomal protein S18 acetylase RimI-like enzyme
MDARPPPLIRPATARDAARIAEVHVRSWQAAYRGLMPAEYLASLDPADRLPRWQRMLADNEPAEPEVLVADRGDGICGFSSFGSTRDEDQNPVEVGEVRAIYLAPEAMGAGVGRQLMAASIGHLTRAGYKLVTLWVLDTNTRARRFYEIAGFRPDGAVKVDDRDGFRLHEVRYRRPLAMTRRG